jgi:hypothetical protein
MIFARTQAAAATEKLSRWDLVAAIADDAVDAGLPISSGQSAVAAKAALDAVGLEMTPGTVHNLTVLAKFDHESTDRQRQEWRRYGTSIVEKVANAGWSQEAAFDLLAAPRRRTVTEVRHALTESRQNVLPDPPDINEVGHKLLHGIGNWFMDEAKFVERAEAEGGLDAYSASVVELYHLLPEKRLDAELRQLTDEERIK